MSMNDPVGLVWDDLETRITSLEEVRQNKIRHYTAQQFLMEAKTLRLPAVAVVYQSSTSQNQQTGLSSLSVELQFGVYVIGDLSRNKGGENLTTTEVTKRIVDAIKNQRSPMGHPYLFGGEFPFDTGVGVGYVHYWNTKAQFTN